MTNHFKKILSLVKKNPAVVSNIMKQRTVALLLALVLLTSFWQYSRWIKRGGMKSLDFAVTVKVQDRIGKTFGSRLDSPLENLVFFAGPGFSLAAILVLTAVYFLLAKGWKKKLVAVIIPLCFGLLVLGELYGKSVVTHPAPPFFLLKNPTTIFPKYEILEQYSYPSGHVARAIFLAIVYLTFMYQYMKVGKKRFKIWMLIFVGAVYIGTIAVAKVYLGQHWLSDILGGTLLSGALSALAFAVL